MFKRVIRAIKLDTSLYKDAAHNQMLDGEAIKVLIATGVVGSFGDFLRVGPGFVLYFFLIAVGLPIALFVQAVFVTVVAKMLGGSGTTGMTFRSMCYANAPVAFAVVPVIGAVGSIWAMVCGVVAVREAHGLSTARALVALVAPLAGLVGIAMIWIFASL